MVAISLDHVPFSIVVNNIIRCCFRLGTKGNLTEFVHMYYSGEWEQPFCGVSINGWDHTYKLLVIHSLLFLTAAAFGFHSLFLSFALYLFLPFSSL